MKYYSTNRQVPLASLHEAVVKGLANDKGLYMPENIPTLPPTFFENIDKMSLQEISFAVSDAFFGEDVEKETLKGLVYDALNFDIPLKRISDSLYSLELFHGPTLAFKDVGARFMARLLGYFIKKEGQKEVRVLVATSGDTGSAVANGFLGVEGIRVFVLYPKGKVSEIQEKQFTTLGQNITALEIDGNFDDCQRLVKTAFLDKELSSKEKLTSANSINVARFLPQSFYYFYAYAQMKRMGLDDKPIVCCVPSGNFGNFCAALIAYKMGLPIHRFIAANNRNDIFYQYLKTGVYSPRPSIPTLANAMDVGDPSNFVRVLEIFNGKWEAMKALVSGATYTDEQIMDTIARANKEGYLLDPHGAVAYRALKEGLKEGERGFFVETAHPAKFKEKVEEIINKEVEVPARLQEFMKREKQSISLSSKFEDFKAFLLKA